ncbi:MAG: agmatine deiminase family protein [Burkholderiaceae bacterium]
MIAQRFGDRDADDATAQLLAEAFPGRRILLLDIDGIAAGGGSIHGATLQQPRPRRTTLSGC